MLLNFGEITVLRKTAKKSRFIASEKGEETKQQKAKKRWTT